MNNMSHHDEGIESMGTTIDEGHESMVIRITYDDIIL